MFDDFYKQNAFPDYADPVNRGRWKGVIKWLFILVLLVLGGLVVLRLFAGTSPAGAARTWLTALVQLDSQKVEEYTCDEQIALANAAGGVDAATELVDQIGLLDLLELPSNIDLEEILKEINLDPRQLDYTSQEYEDGTAIVTVEGRLQLNLFGDSGLGFPIRDRWLMVKENDRWKWCGRI